MDYIIQEKTIVENIFDFEFDTNVTESKHTSCWASAKDRISNKQTIIPVHRSWNIFHGQRPLIRQCSILWQRNAVIHAGTAPFHLHHSHLWQFLVCNSFRWNPLRGSSVFTAFFFLYTLR